MPVYIQVLMTILLICFSIVNLYNERIKFKDLLIIIIISELISLPIVNLEEFLAVMPIIIVAAMVLYKYNKNPIISIAIPITAILIAVISDYLLGNIYLNILNRNISRKSITLDVIILEFILCIGISKIIGIILNKKIKISSSNLKGKFGILIVLSLILTLIIFYTNIILGSKAGFSKDVLIINSILFFTYFILLGIIIFILIRSLKKELEFKSKQKEFENLRQYTDSLEKLYADMRVFRHDYLNIISSMIGYIDNRDIEGLERHFYESIIPISKSMRSNDFKIGDIRNIKIPELKGLLSSKLIRAQEIGIDVHIEIVEDINKINMNIIDLSRVIGILLDNAIEATEKAENTRLKIAFVRKEKSIIIIISNGYRDEKFQLNKIYEAGYSTKGEGRGLGLSNLKNIINKYNNVFLDTYIENEEFIQELEVIK